MEGEGELALAQSSRPAVACRIIVSSPMCFCLGRPAMPARPLICLCVLPAPGGPVLADTASPLHPLKQAHFPCPATLWVAVSLLTFHLNPACPGRCRMNAANSNWLVAREQPNPKNLAEISGPQDRNCPKPNTRCGCWPVVLEGRSTPLFPRQPMYIRGTNLDPQHVNRWKRDLTRKQVFRGSPLLKSTPEQEPVTQGRFQHLAVATR